MKPNRQYFVVSIDKELQKKKRELIVLGGHGYLGVRCAENPDYKGTGVLLSGVEPGSPALLAGLKGKDIIYAVNGVEVHTFEELVEAVSRYSPGDTVDLLIHNSLLQDSADRQTKSVLLGKKEISLENPQTLRDMRHNLQFGEILDMGTQAKKEFPHANIGDFLIFHHAVEHKQKSDTDKNYYDLHLIDHDAQGNEVRIVHCEFEVLGVMVMGKQVKIVPHPRYVFCHYQIDKASIQRDQKTGLYLPDQWKQTVEELSAKIEELKAQEQEIMSSTVMTQRTNRNNEQRKKEISLAVYDMRRERARVTRMIHKAEYIETTVLFYNRVSTQTLGYDLHAGDRVIVDFKTLYPLDIMGNMYSLARVIAIEGAIFLKQPPIKKTKKRPTMSEIFQPLHDRVIVIPDEADMLSDGGIHIPDTAQERPARGKVVAAGPGLKELPTQVKQGDYVLYGKFAGSNVEYQGVKYLFLHESDILTTLSAEEAERAREENSVRQARNEEIKKRLAEKEAAKNLEAKESVQPENV